MADRLGTTVVDGDPVDLALENITKALTKLAEETEYLSCVQYLVSPNGYTTTVYRVVSHLINIQNAIALDMTTLVMRRADAFRK